MYSRRMLRASCRPIQMSNVMILLALSIPAESSEVRSTLYNVACKTEGHVAHRLSGYATVAGRSALECLALCSIDPKCVSADILKKTKVCSFYQTTETNCSTLASQEEPKVSFLEVSTTSCPNGGTPDGNRCLCPPGFEGNFCQLPVVETTTLEQTTPATCQQDWIPFQGSCYKLVWNTTGYNRQEAHDYCQGLSSYLVSIETEAEFLFIRQEILNIDLAQEEAHWWTSGKRDPPVLPWNWYWENGHDTPLDYHPWIDGEPNNDPGEEFFISIIQSPLELGLNDEADSWKCRLICEYTL